jgi:glycine betaine catabolism B
MPLTIARLEFVSKATDDQGATIFHFQPTKPVTFSAGQHGLWYVPNGGIRPFTIASAPEEDEIALGTTLASGSRIKRALAALTRGSTVRLFGRLSQFTLDPAATEVVMLAQGTAVTPFRSILRHLALQSSRPQATLIHVGTAHPFRADTEPLATHTSYPGSREEFGDLVRATAVAQPEASFMIAGTAAFVTSTKALLQANGVPPAHVKSGPFVGWSGPRSVSGSEVRTYNAVEPTAH